LVGVAVNITFVPAQIVFPGEALILTDGVTFPLIVIVIALDVAVAGLAHTNEEVITTVMTSPFTNNAF
jgi:hypothetical protein